MTNPAVENFWLEHYADGHCTLCGNRGVIDTRASAVTPVGKRVGKLNYCICPNGQALREAGAPLEHWFNDYYEGPRYGNKTKTAAS